MNSTTMVPNDYSCYIHINNKTDVDISLVDSTISSGSWPKDNPPNTIEAHNRGRIWLKDSLGSEGSVVYQLYLPNKPDLRITFTLQFTCPYGPWYDNSLTSNTTFGNLISLNVHPFSTNGHPFTASVDLETLGGMRFTSLQGQKRLCEEVDALKAVYIADQHGNLISRAVPMLWRFILALINTFKPQRRSAAVHQQHDDEHLSEKFGSYKDEEDRVSTLDNKNVHTDYEIGFDSDGKYKVKDPIHENITIAAMIASKLHFPPGMTYNNVNNKQWEYLRGVIWNDDPSSLLFDDLQNENHNMAVGLEWWDAFKNGPPNCLTRRSHFGDLQFLHSMAHKDGEEAEVTKKNILRWMEVMYKLACGNQGVSEHESLKSHLPMLFNDSTVPNAEATFRDLLLGTTPSYRQASVPTRALGTCLHMIQDSYAVGHTQRKLLNPDDQLPRNDEGYMQFKSGTYGRFGAIVAFHAYSGQIKGRHSHYDELNDQELIPKKLETFNALLGTRDAIRVCTAFIDFFVLKTRWEDGVGAFLDQVVFSLDPEKEPANSKVD